MTSRTRNALLLALVPALFLLACPHTAKIDSQPSKPVESLAFDSEWTQDGLQLTATDDGVVHLVIPMGDAPDPGSADELTVVQSGKTVRTENGAWVYELNLVAQCPPGAECNKCTFRGDDCVPPPPPPSQWKLLRPIELLFVP